MRFPLVALAVAALAIVLLAIAGPAYRLGLEMPSALAILRWGGYVGLVAAGLAAIAGTIAYRGGKRLPMAAAIVAVVAGLASFVIPWYWQRQIQRAPQVHDVTTDLDNPPVFHAVGPLRADARIPIEWAPGLATLQRDGYPGLEPITLPSPPDATFDRALAIAQSSGWEIITADRASGQLEATDTSRWFGFKDDVVVRVTPWGTGTRVDVRSVSRSTDSDASAHARRIRRFLNEMETGSGFR